MYGAGTWTTTEEHEKMLRTTQRRMLRLIIQTRRKYKNNKNDKDIRNDEISEDTEEKDSTHDEHDQDSISFDDDQDSTTSQEDDLDDLIEYRRSSTKEADEKCCITNLVETQKNIQWRQVLRIATQSQDTGGPEKLLDKDSKESRKTSQNMGRRLE